MFGHLPAHKIEVPSSSRTFTIMSSSSIELAFKKHAESVRICLQTFSALRTIPSDGMNVSAPLRVAVNELINVTVRVSKTLGSYQFSDL